MSSDAPVVPARIVLYCDLESEDGQSLAFSLTESVEMADGTLLQLRADRGWSTRQSGEDDPWKYTTTESMTWDATAVAGFEHDEASEWHQWYSKTLETALSAYNRTEFHHCYPRKHLENEGLSTREINRLASFAFLTRADNRKLGGDAPSSYKSKMATGQLDAILSSVLCPESLFEDDYEKFISQRADLLRAEAQERI